MDAPVVIGNPGCPEVFVSTVRKMVEGAVDAKSLEGVHRIVYLDTATGKRQTTFVSVTVADPDLDPDPSGAAWGSQIRSYVLFPYLLAKDLRSEAVSDDPWGVLTGRVALASR